MSHIRRIITKQENTILVDYTEKSFVIFGFPFEQRQALAGFTQGNGYTRIDDAGVAIGKEYAYMTAKSNEKNLAVIDAYFGPEWRSLVTLPEKKTYTNSSKIEISQTQPTVVKQEITKPISDIFVNFTKLIDQINETNEVKMSNVGEREVIIAGPSDDVDAKLSEYPNHEIVSSLTSLGKKIVYIDYEI